jgi:hypothetical protein
VVNFGIALWHGLNHVFVRFIFTDTPIFSVFELAFWIFNELACCYDGRKKEHILILPVCIYMHIYMYVHRSGRAGSGVQIAGMAWHGMAYGAGSA